MLRDAGMMRYLLLHAVVRATHRSGITNAHPARPHTQPRSPWKRLQSGLLDREVTPALTRTRWISQEQSTRACGNSGWVGGCAYHRRSTPCPPPLAARMCLLEPITTGQYDTNPRACPCVPQPLSQIARRSPARGQTRPVPTPPPGASDPWRKSSPSPHRLRETRGTSRSPAGVPS
mgnify:CR=1 FL=1